MLMATSLTKQVSTSTHTGYEPPMKGASPQYPPVANDQRWSMADNLVKHSMRDIACVLLPQYHGSRMCCRRPQPVWCDFTLLHSPKCDRCTVMLFSVLTCFEVICWRIQTFSRT